MKRYGKNKDLTAKTSEKYFINISFFFFSLLVKEEHGCPKRLLKEMNHSGKGVVVRTTEKGEFLNRGSGELLSR